MKGKSKKPIILFERNIKIEKHDEWQVGNKGWYCLRFCIEFAWNHGFYWGISTNDFSTWDKSLAECVFRALEHMNDDSPGYYRLKYHLFNKGFWRSL